MRKIFLLILCCLPVMTAIANPAAQLTALLNQYTTYQARFHQTTYDRFGGVQQQARGRVWLKRPGKFRWRTLAPQQQLVVSNGKKLWIYDIDLAQATEKPVQTRGGQDPALLLTGNAVRVVSQYVVTTWQAQNLTWFLLRPKLQNNMFQCVKLAFWQSRLVAIDLKNNLGQRSYFMMHSVRLNRPLANSLFHFQPPPGVTMLRAQAQ